MHVLWATGPDTGDKLNYHSSNRGSKYMELENNGAAAVIHDLSICSLTLVFSWIVLAF
jgi:hypothetical protein